MEDKIFYGREDEGIDEGVTPELSVQTVITKEDIADAANTLQQYKAGKANLENRIVEDELWYKMQHWNIVNAGASEEQKKLQGVRSTSAWLFNAITNKHADMMDNFPEPIVLPREMSDEESAKLLSQVLPVVMEYNRFRRTYNRNSYEKLKHGTAVYGVMWDSKKLNGLGDIDITELDLLNVFWEPGVQDVQKSKNFFIVELVDTENLKAEYPECKDMQGNSVVNVTEYLYDENIDTKNKSMVVDWYYKRRMPDGRTVVHYCKFVNNIVLYASENDPKHRDSGYYEHGKYPVVFDTLYPEKGMPTGFGLIAICRNPQLFIDKLSSNILEASIIDTKKRYFISNSANVNEEEFLDWNKPFVHVEGSIDPDRLQEIKGNPISGIYETVLQQKIEEMKETAANRDITSGGTSAGITAASSIAALMEAGNKQSRDIIADSYDNFTDLCDMVIELMRQFYDEPRTFRITNQLPGDYTFASISKDQIGLQMTGELNGEPMYRLPIFDLKIKAQRKNPFSRMEENERAKELYGLGFFAPEKAQESLIALDMMDFEGKDKIIEKVSQGQTLLNLVQQLTQMVGALTGQMGMEPGMEPAAAGQPSGGGQAPRPAPSGGNNETGEIMESKAPRTPYAQRLAKRAKPNMNEGA
jgi:hypothetical protein